MDVSPETDTAVSLRIHEFHDRLNTTFQQSLTQHQ